MLAVEMRFLRWILSFFWYNDCMKLLESLKKTLDKVKQLSFHKKADEVKDVEPEVEEAPVERQSVYQRSRARGLRRSQSLCPLRKIPSGAFGGATISERFC